MALELRKARRSMAKIRIGMVGASGSGKTFSSLILAYGILSGEHPDWTSEQIWDKICIIDTENNSGELYVNSPVDSAFTIGEYFTIQVKPPFEPIKYIDAIHMAEQGGMEVIIIDSMTHAWAGAGGSLDKQGKIADRTGNSYTAWRNVTPEHNKMVDAMIQSSAHIIGCLRAKTEYSQEKGPNGKTQIKNLGMAPIFRDGVEYEFTLCFHLDDLHNATSTKDRTSMFDGKIFPIDVNTGRTIAGWLAEGSPSAVPPAPMQMTKASAQAPVQAQVQPPDLKPYMDAIGEAIRQRLATAGEDQALRSQLHAQIAQEITQIAGFANYTQVTDVNILNQIFNRISGK